MTEWIRSWVMGLVGAALLTAAATALTPAGRVRRVTELICGVVMILALIQPLAELDLTAYSMNLAACRQEMALYENDLAQTNDRLTRRIIEAECGAYILDKAQVLGVTVWSAEVTAKWGDEGCWFPYEVHLEAEDQPGLDRLSQTIEAQLGIPEERQYRSGTYEHD